jgi:hypothetical protein
VLVARRCIFLDFNLKGDALGVVSPLALTALKV